MVDSNKLDAIRKAIATKGVRVTGRNIKSKGSSRLGAIQGRTNATNPKTITDLNQAYQSLKKAQSVKQIDVPYEPRPHHLPIEEHYIRFGEVTGTCPYELRRLMETDTTSGNELVQSAFKKLVAAIKLSTEVDLSSVRQAIKHNDEQNASRHRQWEISVKRAEKHNAECLKDINEKEGEYYVAWGNILIDLVQKTSANPKMDSLGDWDRFMCYALLRTGKQPYQYATAKNDCISIDFNAAKSMPVDMIQNLPVLAARYQEDERTEKFYEWLDKAPIMNLMDALSDPHFADERDLITSTIAARKGLGLKRDHLGRLKWTTDDGSYQAYVEDYGEPIDSEWFSHDDVRRALTDHVNDIFRNREDRDF